MKIRYKRKIGNNKWHKFFAWYPVKIDGYWVWGQTIRRRNISKDKTIWVYAFI